MKLPFLISGSNLGMIQAFHRHIPILIRALGSSYTELLNIVADPPEGSENLLVLVCCFPNLLSFTIVILFFCIKTTLMVVFCLPRCCKF